jgi:hypothetical protein
MSEYKIVPDAEQGRVVKRGAEQGRVIKRVLQPKRGRNKRSGFVYVMQCRDAFKIGGSIDPQRRCREVEVPWPVVIRLQFATDDMRFLEQFLQERFRDKHINGEWFELSEDDIKWIAENVESLHREPIHDTEPTRNRREIGELLDTEPIRNYNRK